MNDNKDYLENNFDEFVENIKNLQQKMDLVWQQYSKERRSVIARNGELSKEEQEQLNQKYDELEQSIKDEIMFEIRAKIDHLDYLLGLGYDKEQIIEVYLKLEDFEFEDEYLDFYKKVNIDSRLEKHPELNNLIEAYKKEQIDENKYNQIYNQIEDLMNRFYENKDYTLLGEASKLIELLPESEERTRVDNLVKEESKKLIIQKLNSDLDEVEKTKDLENLDSIIKRIRDLGLTFDENDPLIKRIKEIREEIINTTPLDMDNELDEKKYEEIYKQIEDLMDKFYENNDYKLLGEVSKLTDLLPESEKRTKVVNLIKEESKKLIIEKLNSELDEVEKTKDLEKLDSIVRRIRDLGLTFDENDPLIKRIKEIREKLTKMTPPDKDNEHSDEFNKINLMLHEYVYFGKLSILQDAKKLIDNMPDGKEKEILLESYSDIMKAQEKEIIRELYSLLDAVEKEKNLDKLNLACEYIKGIKDPEQRNDLMARAAEVNEAIKVMDNDDLDDEKDKPKKKGKKTTLTWKTALATAIGVGIGSAVFFTAGAVGVSVVVIAGGIANKIISNKRTQLATERKLSGPIKVKSVSEPTPGLKGKFEKFKNYLKSEEGLRDITWMINSAMITTGVLSVASLIHNAVSSTVNGGSGVTPEPTPEPQNLDAQTPADVPTQPDVGDMKIGDSLGSNVPEVGYDSVGLANSGMNSEHLISEYVNSDSIIKGVGIQNADGTITRITTNGMSLNEIASKFGVSTDDLVLDVASKDGVSLAWTKLADMVKNVGGKIR